MLQYFTLKINSSVLNCLYYLLKITLAKIHLYTNLLNLWLYFSFIIFSRVNEIPILVITLRAQIAMEFLQLNPEKIQNFTEFNLCYMSIFSMVYFKTMKFLKSKISWFRGINALKICTLKGYGKSETLI